MYDRDEWELRQELQEARHQLSACLRMRSMVHNTQPRIEVLQDFIQQLRVVYNPAKPGPLFHEVHVYLRQHLSAHIQNNLDHWLDSIITLKRDQEDLWDSLQAEVDFWESKVAELKEAISDLQADRDD